MQPASTKSRGPGPRWYWPRAKRGANPAWVPDRLEYRFSAGVTITEGRLTLTAPEHTGDRLDWDAFSGRSRCWPTGCSRTVSVDVAPALLQILGMPALDLLGDRGPAVRSRLDRGRTGGHRPSPARRGGPRLFGGLVPSSLAFAGREPYPDRLPARHRHFRCDDSHPARRRDPAASGLAFVAGVGSALSPAASACDRFPGGRSGRTDRPGSG